MIRPATGDLEGMLRCPVTGMPLVPAGEGRSGLVAEGAPERFYPVIHGIPDFRIFDPPYATREEEADQVAALVEAAAGRDYEALVRFYCETFAHDRSPAAVRKEIGHRLALRERSPGRLGYLFDRVGPVTLPPDSTVLDLGCGSGEAIPALLERGAGAVIGVDISLVELVLARKLLEEEGIAALVVAGCAEAAAFADRSFDLIYSPDVIEHVSDQRGYLTEAYRTLKPGGRILLNSPNRFSVVCPEPHVGIWGLGFLPRALMDPACRLLGKGHYTGKRLVSLRELRSLLDGAFDGYDLRVRPSNPDAASLPGRLYHALSPASVEVFSHVCDQHVVLAERR